MPKKLPSYAEILSKTEIAHAYTAFRKGWYLLTKEAKDDLEDMLINGEEPDDATSHWLERVDKEPDGTYKKTGKKDMVDIEGLALSIRSYRNTVEDRQ